MRRVVSAILIATLFPNILYLALEIAPAGAVDTIYIRADGRVDPPDGRILSSDNVTYVFVSDIIDLVVVERSGVLIDGSNHSLIGLDTVNGLYLGNVSNVTIQNLLVRSFRNGIRIEHSYNVTATRIEITKCKYGFSLVSTTHSTISENNVTGNTYHAIDLSSACDFNVISGNMLALNGEDGTAILSSQHNFVVGNSMTRNGNGVRLGNCSFNTIADNVIADSSATGFASSFSKNNTFVRNNVTKNTAGIVLESSSNHEISENRIIGNYLNGALLDYSSNNTLFSNTVMTNMGQAGISLVFSDVNTISDNCLISNRRGVNIEEASNNLVARNNITKNGCGIYTEDYTRVQSNSIVENNIVNNSCGVKLGIGAENNRISCNNLVSNREQISLAKNASLNCWNDEYLRGGNYWSDYNGTDRLSSPFQNETGCDGIGDTSYTMDANNTDRYPLMGTFSSIAVGLERSANLICNSSISDFRFDGESIRFSVAGYDGTAGFCRICIPAALMNIPYKVFVNSTEASYNLLPSSNKTHNYLYFNLTHSTQDVIIIPELHTFFVLPLLVAMTALLAATFCRRRRHLNLQTNQKLKRLL